MQKSNGVETWRGVVVVRNGRGSGDSAVLIPLPKPHPARMHARSMGFQRGKPSPPNLPTRCRTHARPVGVRGESGNKGY
jgi:hypothetical protein